MFCPHHYIIRVMCYGYVSPCSLLTYFLYFSFLQNELTTTCARRCLTFSITPQLLTFAQQRSLQPQPQAHRPLNWPWFKVKAPLPRHPWPLQPPSPLLVITLSRPRLQVHSQTTLPLLWVVVLQNPGKDPAHLALYFWVSLCRAGCQPSQTLSQWRLHQVLLSRIRDSRGRNKRFFIETYVFFISRLGLRSSRFLRTKLKGWRATMGFFSFFIL
jgi:hypothetical protein